MYNSSYHKNTQEIHKSFYSLAGSLLFSLKCFKRNLKMSKFENCEIMKCDTHLLPVVLLLPCFLLSNN